MSTIYSVNSFEIKDEDFLRDWFACHAMREIIGDGRSIDNRSGPVIAKYSYNIADAMMKERQRGGDEDK